MKKGILILLRFVVLCFPAIIPAQSQLSIKDEIFVVKTLTPLSASANRKGDKFTLQVQDPGNYTVSMIEAEVVSAKAAGRVKGKSELLFSFNKLTLAGGATSPIIADLQEVTNSKGVSNVDEEGRVIGKSSTKKDVTRTAVLGGLGAVIGGIAGGASGAAKGAAIGAAIGLTVAFSTQGEDIKFAAGSVFKIKVSTKDQQNTQR
jgi:hypothetical protein